MRKTLKILHTLAACGLVGGLFAYMILLVTARQDTAAAYADLRWSIAAVSDYILLPSLAVALISGLLSMVVHPPFQDKRWVWVKAALGILMFKGVLTIIGAKAHSAHGIAERIANGEAAPDALDTALAYEWYTLGAVLALSVANIVLGVWRPRLKKRRRAPAPTTDGVLVRTEPTRRPSY